MSTLTTVTIASGSGDSVTTALESLWANQQLLEKTRADTSDPTAPANGEMWIRTDGANNGVLYAQINGVKTEVLFQPTLNVDLDLNGNQLKNAVHEKLVTGSLPAAGAATEGEMPWDSTVERHVSISSTDQYYLARCNLDGTTYMQIQLDLAAGSVTGPGTNPGLVTDGEWRGRVFDAVGEELLLSCVVPDGFTAAHDIILRLHVALQGAEDVNDLIKWNCDWRTITPGSGDTIAIAEESTTGNTDIGAVVADQTVHACDITIDHDAVGNVIAAGDMLGMVVGLTAIGGAGEITNGVLLLRAVVLVPIYNLGA
jgi:hypothetical protein